MSLRAGELIATPELKKRLKTECDEIVLYLGIDSDSRGYDSTIVIPPKSSDPAHYREMTIFCAAEAKNYGFGCISQGRAPVHYPHCNDEWLNAVNFMKKGDEISLKWVSHDVNQWVKDAGLTQDKVYLVIKRKNPAGKVKEYKFLVSDLIFPVGHTLAYIEKTNL